MNEPVKNQTNVVKRRGSSVWYYRARYPSDLVGHYGKPERWISLRTRDQNEANKKATLLQLRLDQEFAHARALLSSAPTQDISDIELDRIALLWAADLLAQDEQTRIEGVLVDDEFFDELGDETEHLSSHFGEWLARGDYSHIKNTVEHELAQHGIKVAEDSPIYRKACNAFVKAGKKAFEGIKLRQSGEVFETPTVERVPVTPKSEDTLQYLCDYWKKQKSPAIRTAQEADTLVKRINAQTGNKSASKITKADIVEFKDKLSEDGKSSATIKKQLNLLKTIYNVAVKNSKATTNPAYGVDAPAEKNKKKARIPFSLEDLNLLFNSEVFTQGLRPRGGAGEASFWLPLIALWTGARLNEIGQLLVEDIEEENGIKYFHVTDEADEEDEEEDKVVKTQSSKRKVPIHPELLRLGFMAYYERIKKDGHTRLFPLLKSSPTRKPTASFSQWFGRYKRKLGITDKRKVFHSFRHGFKDACRNCGVAPEHHDKLTGHAKANVGDGYGAEYYPLKPLNEAIKTLRYEGLDLSHLHRTS